MTLQRIQIRRGTSTQWNTQNPVLLAGEMGFATDTGVMKIGNGTSVWSSLPASPTTQDIDLALIPKQDRDTLAQDVTGSQTATRIALDTLYVQKSVYSGLMPWRSFYASRFTSPVRIFTVSYLEGIGASTPVYANTWQRLLELELREHQTGGVGFLPPFYASASITEPFTRVGSVTENITSGQGPGGRLLNIPGSSTVTTPSIQMTGLRVWYGKNNFFSGSADLKVDGVTVQNISSVNAGGMLEAQTWPALPAAPYATTNAAHAIQLAGTGGGNFFHFEGLELFNGDENFGVHLYDGTQTDLTASTLTSSNYVNGHWEFMKVVDPHLVIIMLGAPEWGNSPDFFTSSLQSIVDTIDTKLTGYHSVLLAMPPRPVKVSNPALSVWSDYVEAARDIAVSQPSRVAFIDLQEHWPVLQSGGATNMGLMNETTSPYNPSQAGHRRIAEILAGVLQ